MLTEYFEAEASALAKRLADSIAARLIDAIAARGSALMAVAGGKSPVALFEHLSCATLPWEQVCITLVDERWVAADSVDSNENLLRRHLLVGPAAHARFLPLKNDAQSAEQGHAACEAAVSKLPMPFDVVLLGMGDDGHIASLFPHAPQLAWALDPAMPQLCIATEAAVAPHERLSLTLKALLRSRLLILQITGNSKLATYHRARQPGPNEAMPVRAVLRQSSVPIEIWQAASS